MRNFVTDPTTNQPIVTREVQSVKDGDAETLYHLSNYPGIAVVTVNGKYSVEVNLLSLLGVDENNFFQFSGKAEATCFAKQKIAAQTIGGYYVA